MSLRAKRTWPVLAALYGLLLAVLLLSAHWRLDGPMGKAGYNPVAKVKKDFRSHHGGGAEFPLRTSALEWTPDLPPSFLKVDRKQNLLVWPVLASGNNRSPPAEHSL